MTSNQNIRVHPLHILKLHAKYEVYLCLLSTWSYVKNVFSLTSDDLRWCMTFTKNNRTLPFNMGYLHTHTMYESCRCFPSWDTVVTSKVSQAPTHTHMSSLMHRFLFQQNQKHVRKPETWVIDAVKWHMHKQNCLNS